MAIPSGLRNPNPMASYPDQPKPNYTPVPKTTTVPVSSGSSSAGKSNVLAKSSTPSGGGSGNSTPRSTTSTASVLAGAGQRVVDAVKVAGIQLGNLVMPGQPFGQLQIDSGRDVATAIATNPFFLFGAPAAVAVAPLLGVGGATTTAAATTSAAAAPSLFKTAGIAAAAGIGGGLVGGFLGGSSPSNAPQTVTQQPTQTTAGTQTTQSYLFDSSQRYQYQVQNYSIVGSPGAAITGTLTGVQPGAQQGVSPDFSQNPDQDTSSNPSQTASSGTNWGLIAALAVGAFVLLRD